MYHVHVSVTIDAEQDKVFALLSDHERFLRGPDFKCRLITAGSIFTEEVTAWEPPKHYAYIVRTLIGPIGKPTPFTHERGWMDISPEGTKTRVDWQSRFGMPIPVVGWMLERIVGPRIRHAFVTLLASAKLELERTKRPS
jgi:hypothetical protein